MEIEKIEQITDLFNDPNICELKMNNIHQSIAECRQISLPKEPLFEFEQPPQTLTCSRPQAAPRYSSL